MTALAATTTTGFAEGFDAVPVALHAVRERLLALSDRLSPEEWGRPSRCERWTVHDVVRHVRDACLRHAGRLRGDEAMRITQPFDARETPNVWLERTAGEPPAATVAALRAAAADEEEALDHRLAHGPDGTEMGPYGPIHWTVLSAHVLWDAWLHERDVCRPLDVDVQTTPAEEGAVALYGLLIATVPALLLGRPCRATVALTAGGGRAYQVSLGPGSASVRPASPEAPADLRGELGAVVDSLAGRGPLLADVLRGDAALCEPLTLLRALLVPTP